MPKISTRLLVALLFGTLPGAEAFASVAQASPVDAAAPSTIHLNPSDDPNNGSNPPQNPGNPQSPNSPHGPGTNNNDDDDTGGLSIGVGTNDTVVTSSGISPFVAGGGSTPELGDAASGVFPQNSGAFHAIIEANGPLSSSSDSAPIIPAGR